MQTKKQRFKGNNHVYLIQHIPSGLQYIGVHEKHAIIRFEEHMLGFGSEYIWQLICAGSTRQDFKLEILSSHSTVDESVSEETRRVKEFNTAFPYGMNIERNSSGWTKYNTLKQEYCSRGFCVKIIDYMIQHQWNMPQQSALQELIEIRCRNQTVESQLSLEQAISLRRRFAQSYSLKEKIRTDGDKFRAGRKKLKDRINSGALTRAEEAARSTRSETTKRVWDGRSQQNRREILTAATAAAAVKNRKNA